MFELLLLGKKVGNNGQIYTGSGLCIFAGGANSSTTVKITDKYFLKDDTALSGTSLSIERRETYGAGNAAEGYVFGGAGLVGVKASVECYAYSSGSVTAATSMLYAVWGMAATSNDAQAIISGGYNTSTTQKLNYSTKAMSAATSLDAAIFRHCASGNLQSGFFFKTNTTRAATRQYEYSTGAWINGTNLTLGGEGAASAGTSAYAVVSSGYAGSGWVGTEKYQYSTHTKSAGVNLSMGRIYLTAAGDKEKCLFGLGRNYSGINTNTVEGYYFSNNTTAPGTALSSERYGAASLSAPPGWVA